MSAKKTVIIDGHEIELSNLDKILFPKSGLTKQDLISYYKDVAARALPFYKNRPLTMVRCPDGIDHQNFMQKEAPSYLPNWIDRYTMTKKDGHVRHVLVNNQATFVYLANQACISFHLALSCANKIHNPRLLLFDIDPSCEDMTLLKGVLKKVKELLDGLGLRGFLQTTGSRGFHVCVPLKPIHTFDQTHEFAKLFAQHLVQLYPQEMTTAQSKAKREQRVFIDYARNSYGLNAIGPYSVRPKEKAPIATPLHWEELDNKTIHPQTFNMTNIFQRLSNLNDPWKDMLKVEHDLTESQKELEKFNK